MNFPDPPVRHPRLHDYNTWTYPEPCVTTAEEIETQLKFQKELEGRCNAKFGANAFVSPLAAFLGHKLDIGENSYVSAYCYITEEMSMGSNSSMNIHCVSRGEVNIGNDVRIGAYTSFIAVNHVFDDPDVPFRLQGNVWKKITIGDDVWVGSNVTVMAGVTIGSYAIVGAGAIVTKDIPEYAIAVGNPARVVRDRRDKGKAAPKKDLETSVKAFGEKAAEQWKKIITPFESSDPKFGPCYLEKPDMPHARCLRRTADAIEIAAMFGSLPPLMDREGYVKFFQQFQDPATGLFFEPWIEESREEPELMESRWAAYNFLTAGYSLELLDAKPLHPISILNKLSPQGLIAKLNSLPWSDASWGAGAWIDHYSTAAYLQKKYFQPDFSLETLFGWTALHADPFTGMWGKPTREEGWLQAVNGFYRMTRGSYAQFGVPLPYPERSIDTILAHAGDARYFAEGQENACNVLDVVHPLWLCAKQTEYRKAEITAWMLRRLPLIFKKWHEDRGFAFHLEPGSAPESQPSLQGTEMWLSIIFLMCDYLGISAPLSYRPKGVHRIEVPLPLIHE
ncbi:MAG: acyltransferase [Chthoniobacterales bacterium]